MAAVTQTDYQQFVDKVKEHLSKRLDVVSLRLDDVALIAGEKEGEYVFVGWASSPITRQAAQFSLDFMAVMGKEMDVDVMVDKLTKQVTEYFYAPQVIVPAPRVIV